MFLSFHHGAAPELFVMQETVHLEKALLWLKVKKEIRGKFQHDIVCCLSRSNMREAEPQCYPDVLSKSFNRQ